MKASVLLMTTDSAVAADVGKALQVNGHALTSVTARDPRELALVLARDAAPVVLVDLDPQPRQVLAEVARIAERFPATRFVALTSTPPADILLDAMEAGVRRVVTKQDVRSELQTVLNRITPTVAAGDGGRRGRVITILSAGGGCGATTVAANLAHELGGIREGEPALLVDLDLNYGALSLYFGVEPLYAIDHLMAGDRMLDVELIRSTASAVSPRLHLLASTASTSFSRPAPVDLTRVGAVLEYAGRAYQNTVVDAPRVSMDVAAALAAESSDVLLLFQLTVKNIRIARAMVDALDERGVPRGHLVPVANRVARGAAVTPADAGQVLGAPVRTLRNDYASAIEGFNFGKPLAETTPKSILRRDLQELMASLTAPRAAGVTGAHR